MANIIFTIPDDLSAEEITDLRYLFSDAINAFIATRTPEEHYVNTAYGGHNSGKLMLADKVAQVRRRVALAKKLYNATLNFEILEEGNDHDEEARLVFNGGDPRVLVSSGLYNRDEGLKLAKKIAELSAGLSDRPIVRVLSVVKKDD